MSSPNSGPWKKYKLSLTERLDVQEDLRLFILNQQRMQRLLKRPCAIKKSMVDVSELIFQLPKDPTLPPLVYTWEDLLTEEVVVVTAVAAVVTAAAVTETMTTAATAAGMVEAVEAVAPLLLITEADHEGITAHGP